ncbi:MAG: hypothetical protein LC119_11455 [Burkholderiales bacterium]|nr:hypothetical protein [Burkholderiales bacterium]
MDNPTRTPDDMFSARRRLLRGSFSAPAVLTLASGSALAAQSATCLAKATANSSTAPVTTTAGADTFMRVQLMARPPAPSGVNPRYLVTKASFGLIPVSTSFWPASTVWWRFDISTNTLMSGGQRFSAVPGDATLVNYWVALRLDANGQIIGLGASGSGSVVGQSCWNSIGTSP